MGKITKILIFVAGAITVLMSFFTTSGKAKDYLPVLVDGREWVYRDSAHYRQGTQAVHFWVQRTFCKDTLINGKLWKEVSDYFSDTIPETRVINETGIYFHEDNGIVYGVFADMDSIDFSTCSEYFNMDLKVGEIFKFSKVVKVDSIKVRDVVRKRITLEGGIETEPYSYMVEGIGISNTAYGSYLPGMVVRYVLWVKDAEGNIIFTQDDFRAPSYSENSGMDAIGSEGQVDDRIYDLYGRPVANPLSGTVYIRRGHKFVQPR